MSYFCTSNAGGYSSVGLERLLDRQEVGSSNLPILTNFLKKAINFDGFFSLLAQYMNYLSHFFLSTKASNDIHLGNFLGDIVRKSTADTLPSSIQKGIDFHRFIDQFTDNHALVLEGKRLLYSSFGKYASVILDIYFDFLLIEHWEEYSNEPIQFFLEKCYGFLDSHIDSIPEHARPRVRAMYSAKWMNGYLSNRGRSDLFCRLAKRAKYDQNFDKAQTVYASKKIELSVIHQEFFPILQQACAEWLF